MNTALSSSAVDVGEQTIDRHSSSSQGNAIADTTEMQGMVSLTKLSLGRNDLTIGQAKNMIAQYRCSTRHRFGRVPHPPSLPPLPPSHSLHPSITPVS